MSGWDLIPLVCLSMFRLQEESDLELAKDAFGKILTLTNLFYFFNLQDLQVHQASFILPVWYKQYDLNLI